MSFHAARAEQWRESAWTGIMAQAEILKDNTYAGTFGDGGWGAKASEVLMQTKGKGFRHEKTKKKRGSYKGGKIDDNQVNSFKFAYDSE